MSETESPEIIQSVYSHYIIIGCSIGGLVWGGVNAMFVSALACRLVLLASRFTFTWVSNSLSLRASGEKR